MPFVVWIPSSNRYFIGIIVLEILRCKDFGVLAWNCLFTPFFGEFLGNIFPIWRHPSSWPPKRHFLGRKHVIWAIQRKNQCDGSTWAQDRKKQCNKKVTKVLYFPYLGGSPRWADSTIKPFQIKIFMGYDITVNRIFDFPIDFSIGLTTVQR